MMKKCTILSRTRRSLAALLSLSAADYPLGVYGAGFRKHNEHACHYL